MKVLTIICPACGASIESPHRNGTAVCAYCGTKVMLDEGQAEKLVELHDPFAGLPMNACAEKACKEFLNSVDENDFQSTPKILKGLGLGPGETVYLIHDDTLFKNGKNGFAITEKGMYCRPFGEQTLFTSWEDFASVTTPLKLDDNYIKHGNRRVCYYTGQEELLEEQLLPMYEALHKHAINCFHGK